MVSVIIATYNRADYLRLCLAAVGIQEGGEPIEVIVADDGSSDHTETVIARARTETRFSRLLHVRQEHKGFRKAAILNKAVRRASGDLLIFLDSDCIPRPELVSVYVSHRARGRYYLGGVCKLNEAYARKVLAAEPGNDLRAFFEGARRRENQLPRQKAALLRRLLRSRVAVALDIWKPKIWGGNFAVERDVFEAVNGFDENYVGWGREDSDLRNRLRLGGFQAVPLHLKARAYHLWHPKPERFHLGPDGEPNNFRYYKRSCVEVVCRNGLVKR